MTLVRNLIWTVRRTKTGSYSLTSPKQLRKSSDTRFGPVVDSKTSFPIPLSIFQGICHANNR